MKKTDKQELKIVINRAKFVFVILFVIFTISIFLTKF
jgi:hypothetical protein